MKRRFIMAYPHFYEQVPTIRTYDPLAYFLGACDDGVIEISYLDCVKLAGHSCPTVAGAYIMTYRALGELFTDGEAPVRSQIEVSLSKPKSDGVTGVIGTVCAYICGAGDEGGFAGIGGNFSRRGLLRYGDSEVKGYVSFKRKDTGAYITMNLDTSVVGADPRMMPLMQKAISGEADDMEFEEFTRLWQGRVESMVTQPILWEEIALIADRG
jgi:hypothetical protein